MPSDVWMGFYNLCTRDGYNIETPGIKLCDCCTSPYLACRFNFLMAVTEGELVFVQ